MGVYTEVDGIKLSTDFLERIERMVVQTEMSFQNKDARPGAIPDHKWISFNGMHPFPKFVDRYSEGQISLQPCQGKASAWRLVLSGIDACGGCFAPTGTWPETTLPASRHPERRVQRSWLRPQSKEAVACHGQYFRRGNIW